MISFHKWMVGIALTVIMVASLGTNALLFSARNFQFNLAQIAPTTNGVISVQELMDVETQIRQIESDTAGPRGEQIQVERQLAALAEADSTTQNVSRPSGVPMAKSGSSST